MNIGLGLPVDDPAQLFTWARRADASPFSTLGLLDRLVYDNPPLVTLATLAGATSRVRVQTDGAHPRRSTPPHTLLAKQHRDPRPPSLRPAASPLRLGVGGREDELPGRRHPPRHRRGRPGLA